jgi:hypothetical protein
LLRWKGLAAAELLLIAATSRAEGPDTTEPATGPIVDVHAFVSQSYILTLTHDWLAPNTTNGSFDLSEGGINFTREVTDRMRIGAQLFAQLLEPAGNYLVRMDWIYLDYRFWDWLGLRAGRLKVPLALYNEFADIDAARVPILLPQSVYPQQVREFLLAQTGFDVYGRIGLRSAGTLDYSAFAGTIGLTPTSFTVAPAVIDSVDVPYALGGRIIWETPLEGLRMGGSMYVAHAEGTLHVGAVPFELDLHQFVWIGSIEYARENLLLTAEYAQRDQDFRMTPAMAFSIPSNDSPAGYVMANYRCLPWLQLSAYYSLQLGSFHKPVHSGDEQNDLAATVRFDINRYWLVKLEGHYLYGTLGLGSLLVSESSLDALSPSWGAFLARTTATF